MDLLNTVLKKIFSQNPELGKGVHEARILELWSKAMGEPISKHARATQIQGSTLFIAVEQPVWRQELHSNKMLALKKLNHLLREELGPPPKRDFWVEELFFQGAGAGGLSPNASRSGKAYTRKGRAGRP
ncbi:DUF721 domain-containing protein [bacterium]|jgi:hypothetical protein|nr:DUF721 domain-containing protein [bacterium]